MVVQTDEKEFTGRTLQEYLDWKYPKKEDKEKIEEISVEKINKEREEENITENLEGGELELKEYCSLTKIKVHGLNLKTPLTKLGL